MKFLSSKITVLACFMALFAISSCTADENIPQAEPDLQEMAYTEGNIPGEIPKGATACCSVSGASQLMAYWQNDIDDVLGCCYTETLSGDFPHCNYYPWGNAASNTVNKTVAYQYPASQYFPASQINVLITYMADAVETLRPSSSWMISDIQFVPYGGCTAGYKCFRLKIEYKRLLCSATGDPQDFKPL